MIIIRNSVLYRSFIPRLYINIPLPLMCKKNMQFVRIYYVIIVYTGLFLNDAQLRTTNKHHKEQFLWLNNL